jgi:ankyrin repeat protein
VRFNWSKIMRLFIAALLMTLGTQAWAECGNLCNEDWWKTATTSDVKAELDAGADVMARDKDGGTPLHSAALFGKKAGVIEALLEAGADPKAKDELGNTPWDLAQGNDKLKDTKSYWALNDAQYN